MSSTLARAVAAFIRGAIDATEAHAGKDEADIVAYLAALLRIANGAGHELPRSSLFALVEAHLKANLAAIRRRAQSRLSSASPSARCTVFLRTAIQVLSGTC